MLGSSSGKLRLDSRGMKRAPKRREKKGQGMGARRFGSRVIQDFNISSLSCHVDSRCSEMRSGPYCNLRKPWLQTSSTSRSAFGIAIEVSGRSACQDVKGWSFLSLPPGKAMLDGFSGLFPVISMNTILVFLESTAQVVIKWREIA